MIEVAGYRLVRDIETYLDDASGLHGAIFDRPWSRDDLQDLLVMPGNRSAIELYESLGMTTFDRRRNYYKSADGSHADAILMQLIFDI